MDIHASPASLPELDEFLATFQVRFRRRHWFSFMGTFLPFEIITYATCIWKISCTDSRLSRRPKATAGTSRVVKWTRRKLCTTQYTHNSLCNPVVALAYVLVFLRKVAHFRRRARKNASACLAWISVSIMV